MNQTQQAAIAAIEAQQKTLGEYSPARMVGEQLKEICRREPESAELLLADLQGEGMRLTDAEKKIKARADEIHKLHSGNGVAVPPWEAEDILRTFYGLPARRFGPGREEPEPPAEAPTKPAGNILRLTDFF